MRKLIFIGIGCLLLSGCARQPQGTVSGSYETEYKARVECARAAASGTYEVYLPYDFKVHRHTAGYWQCIQVYGSELEQQKKDSYDEMLADRDGLTLSEYRKNKADSMKRIEQAYKDLFMAKERLYEDYRKDGKLHTDTYTLPDGSVRSVTIQGDKRCESYVDASGSSSSCI
ncbi:hypothetical protein ACNUYN_004311 [Escherichia coli]